MPSWTEHYCHNCAHWTWDSNLRLSNGKIIFPGHCGLYSSACATAIFNHKPAPPPYFSPMDEVYEEVPNK